MQSDALNIIKSRVSTLQLGQDIGLKPDAHGFCRCPYHDDHHASLKLYPSDKGFYCFSCHQSGDVISLAQHEWCTDFMTTLQRLDDMYHLGLDLNGKKSTDQERLAALQKQKEEERERKAQKALAALTLLCYWTANDLYEDLLERVAQNAPGPFDDWPDDFCQDLDNISRAGLQMEFWNDEMMVRMMNRK